MKRSKMKKFYTGVSLDIDLVQYVDHLALQLGCTRSLALNLIIREYCRREGTPASQLLDRETQAVIE